MAGKEADFDHGQVFDIEELAKQEPNSPIVKRYREIQADFDAIDKRKSEAAKRESAAGMKRETKGVKMAKGGYVSSADGCAIRGKTKGRIV
jgi:hypothetical protein